MKGPFAIEFDSGSPLEIVDRLEIYPKGRLESGSISYSDGSYLVYKTGNSYQRYYTS